MIFVYYFFAAIQTFFAYKSYRSGNNYLNYFKSELSEKKSEFTPFVTVFVPCRGIDKDLPKNLTAIFQQDYPKFEVIFVMDNKDDAAASVIEKTAKNFSSQQLKNTKTIIAGKAVTSGQKVHNLRTAVLQANEKSEIFVFVDSDVRPGKKWLRNLAAPLEDEKIGCATGYRWFIQKRGGFSTHFRSVWNASIASALGENMENNFCWGGSTAIRREVFDKLEVRKKWKGTLSDDFALTNALREAKMPIYFVPQCLTATVEDCTFGELLEFTTRQMKITKVYSPTHFKISLIGSILFTFTFWTGMILLFFVSGTHFRLTLLLNFTIFTLGFIKAWVRLNAVKLVLGKYEKELNKQFLPQILMWTISPILYIYNDFAAIFSRKIIWRGIEYELKSTTETIIGKKDGN